MLSRQKNILRILVKELKDLASRREISWCEYLVLKRKASIESERINKNQIGTTLEHEDLVYRRDQKDMESMMLGAELSTCADSISSYLKCDVLEIDDGKRSLYFDATEGLDKIADGYYFKIDDAVKYLNELIGGE